MADIANRYGDNIQGKFYVDNQCIDCDLCRETAPDNFTRSDDGGYSFVYKQPATPEEEARCKEAMEGCPVEAIGNNGDATLANGKFCGPQAKCLRVFLCRQDALFFVRSRQSCSPGHGLSNEVRRAI